MIVQFEKEYLKELFEKGKTSDKHQRFQPQVIRKYILRVMTLKDAPNIEALYSLNSLHYEVLSGEKAGIYSIRIDSKYRLEFIVSVEEGEPKLTICRLIDISNHYK